MLRVQAFQILITLLILNQVLPQKTRVKRKVVFNKNSKFFYRLNGRNAINNITDIFAQGWGIRVNYDLPDSIQKRFNFFKRDIHDDLDFDNEFISVGVACVFKQVCKLVNLVQNHDHCGLVCQLGQLIELSSSKEADYLRSIISKCNFYSNKCPYSFEETSFSYG